MAPTVPLMSKFTTARMRFAFALCVITSVCIVSHSMCDVQMNYESLESCLLHEYKLMYTKLRKIRNKYLFLFYAQMCVSHANA